MALYTFRFEWVIGGRVIPFSSQSRIYIFYLQIRLTEHHDSHATVNASHSMVCLVKERTVWPTVNPIIHMINDRWPSDQRKTSALCFFFLGSMPLRRWRVAATQSVPVQTILELSISTQPIFFYRNRPCRSMATYMKNTHMWCRHELELFHSAEYFARPQIKRLNKEEKYASHGRMFKLFVSFKLNSMLATANGDHQQYKVVLPWPFNIQTFDVSRNIISLLAWSKNS